MGIHIIFVACLTSGAVFTPVKDGTYVELPNTEQLAIATTRGKEQPMAHTLVDGKNLVEQYGCKKATLGVSRDSFEGEDEQPAPDFGTGDSYPWVYRWSRKERHPRIAGVRATNVVGVKK